MPNQTTANLTNSIRAQYVASYFEAAAMARAYDQFATAVGQDMANLAKGSSVVVPFLSALPPSTQVMPETGDIVTTQFVDATATVTPTSRTNAILFSEKLEDQVFTDFTQRAFKAVGENMMQSVDLLAKTAAVTGSFTKSPAVRASLDAGTTTHNIARKYFTAAAVMLQAMKVPMFQTPSGGKWLALMHPFVYNDLMADTAIVAVSEYSLPNIIMNFEMGEFNNFKLIVTPFAKSFWGAGVVNASSVATTITTDTSPLDKTCIVTANTNIVAGMRCMIGTVETATTQYDNNESFIIAATPGGTTVTIVGEGENGGFRYPHSATEVFKNADNVFPVCFGADQSLGKVYDSKVGEYGEIIGPRPQGLADQYTSLAWKWYGGYGIISQNRILRSEFSATIDA